MRGLAALVVVFHHILLASSPALASEYAGGPARVGTLKWWLLDTPVHLFWAGPEAVVVFFVLSGFVLALPAVRRGVRWFRISYYPKRFARLYIPVWAAIIVAVAWRVLQTRPRIPASSWWLQQHSVPMTVHGALVQATLRDTGTWAFDPVLWSLHWEVLYSAVLPLVLVLVVASRSRPWLAAAMGAASLCASGWGTAAGDARLEYLPMFVLGAVLAFHHQRMSRALGEAPKTLAWPLAAAAVGLLTCNYWLRPEWVHTARAKDLVVGASEAGVVAGAAAVIVVALARPGWRSALGTAPFRWLGSRSYSLYLVHEPIVVTLAFAFGATEGTGVLLAAALPAALVAAELFWRAAESPAIRAARALERRVDRLLGAKQRGRQVPGEDPTLVVVE